MKKFLATFSGKVSGSIGLSEKFYNVPVVAENEGEALLALYNKYDHIMFANFTVSNEKVFQSFYDKTIFICICKGGWHLAKGVFIDSPLNLITDEQTRKLVILEANILAGYEKPLQEFKKGDTITFNAYEDQEITAKILEVSPPIGAGFMQDHLYTYKLEGISDSLISVSSGRVIKESIYFACPKKYPFEW